MNKITFIGSITSSYKKNKDQDTNLGTKAGIAGTIGGVLIKRKLAPAVLGVAGSGNLIGAGADLDSTINSEKARYKKAGNRTRMSKIGHDTKAGAKIGANLVGSTLAINNAFGAKGLKKKIAKGLIGGLKGVTVGALGGGTLGAGVGTTRGLVQKNKTKNKYGF